MLPEPFSDDCFRLIDGCEPLDVEGLELIRLDCLVSCVAAASGGLPGESPLKQIGFDVSDDTLLRTIKK